VAGAVLATLFYGWLARGELDPGLTGRGIVGSLVVVGAGAPFISPWVAALSGALYGLLLAPAMYLVERVFRLDDRGAVVSVHGFAALWGLLTVALFADGRAGTQVVGYLAGGAARDAGQLYAQLLGLGAIGILAALVPWTLLTLIAQAYALPPRVREAARLRAAQAQERNWARERERRQGRSLGARQQAWATYLRITARSLRRLSRRKRQYPSRPPHIRSA
jgi:ammonia channel protein AmtB